MALQLPLIGMVKNVVPPETCVEVRMQLEIHVQIIIFIFVWIVNFFVS